MKRILVVTEATEKVASGHLMECIEIADVLQEKEYHISFLVNDDMPQAFRKRIPIPYRTYPHDLLIGREKICRVLFDEKIDLAIFNFRCIEDELLQYVRARYQGLVLCIDELGHRHLSCDIIVNPMIDAYYHVYEDLDARLYAGANYLVLPSSIREFHKREKEIRDKMKRVCVSMGGVDPFGTTVKLSKWIPQICPGVYIDIVLGGGFPYWKELEPNIKENNRVSVHRNIDYIYELFFEADLAFCAGGNTLHELACIGTPSIVIPSMPHEVRNGKAFEMHGFGICLPITREIGYEDVQKGIIQYVPFRRRKLAMSNGRKCTDGNGRIQIRNIVDALWQ